MKNNLLLRWNNRVIFETPDGAQRVFKNSAADNFRRAIAAALADQDTGTPSIIKVGKGTLTENALSNGSNHATFRTGDVNEYQKFAQGFQVSANAPAVDSVAVYLQRTGVANATIQAKIQTNSGGFPSGTNVTNGVSNTIAFNTVESLENGGWVRLTFPDPLPVLTGSTQYHLVIETTGYTYSAGTTMLKWYMDATPVYASGVMSGHDGNAWTDTGTDAAIFKIIGRVDGSRTDLISPILSKSIVAKSRYNLVTARFLAPFAVSEAIDYIAEAGLFDDANNLLAIANVDFDKSGFSTGLNIYWLAEVDVVGGA